MPLHRNTIISFVGRSKAGKSTLARGVARYLRTAHIEVSDIVKFLGPEKIKDKPEILGPEIAKTIERRLEAKKKTVIVVSGIRELEPLLYLKNRYNYYGFEIKAELPVRFDRSMEEGTCLTADEFLRKEILELDLGLEEVEDDAPFAVPTSPLTNPDRLTKAIVKQLRTKGANLR